MPIFDTCRYPTPKTWHPRPNTRYRINRQPDLLNCLALTDMYPGSLGITRSSEPELSRIDTLSLIALMTFVPRATQLQGRPGWPGGLDQGYRRADRRHTTHTPLVLRSFSAERRRTNKSWDPAWNCVGRLLLLPPRHSVLSHRCTRPRHRQRQAGE